MKITPSNSYIQMGPCNVCLDVLKMVPLWTMRRYGFIPLDLINGKLLIAYGGSQKEMMLNDLSSIFGYEIDVLQVERQVVLDQLQELAKIKTGMSTKRQNPDESLTKKVLQNPDDETAVSDLLLQIQQQAVQKGASDIHLEPHKHSFFIRFRIDGLLITAMKLSPEAHPALTSRIKVLSSMDITEKRLPQDNHFSTTISGKTVDFRVSTIPTEYGEKVVMRVLNKSGFTTDITKIGMSSAMTSDFEGIIRKPQGFLLVTGPTGSGKTTTLYSVLGTLLTPEKNIITLEDPIEYDLTSGGNETGIVQVPINPKINMTFAAGLRAALRQDPDIVMVGEIRDQETAEIAMKAALTGHFVLSTIHTNDSFSTILRLRDMGVDNYLIASTVVGIVAQRLIRVLCPECKSPYSPPMAALKRLFPESKLASNSMTPYRPMGCDNCHGGGYAGRKAIFELMVMNDDVMSYIQQERNPDPADPRVRSSIKTTLRESALELVMQGITTIEEVLRVTA